MGVGSPKAAAHHPAKQNNKCTSELGGRRRPPVTLALVHIPLAAQLTASRSPQAQAATTSGSAAAYTPPPIQPKKRGLGSKTHPGHKWALAPDDAAEHVETEVSK